MSALIYRQSKSANQSGQAKAGAWILEILAEIPKTIDPLMGWTGVTETATQVKLRFETKEDAIAYADRKGLSYEVKASFDPLPNPKDYAGNFAFNRVG